MAGWNGSGVFSVPYLFVQDSANGIKILSSRQDTQWATVVAGLNNCMCKDGQNAAIANLNMGGNKLTNMGNGSASTDAAAFGQIGSALLTGAQFRKNWLLNGAMQISQRDVTNVVSVNAATGYVLDRWQAQSGAGQLAQFSQITGIANPPFQFAQRIQRPSGSAVTTIQLAQSLESFDSYPMQGQNVTLSFWARAGATYSPASGALNASLYTGTGTDGNVLTGYAGSAQPINYSPNLTTSWVRYQVTATLSSTLTELGIVFTMTPVGTAGATDYFDITGVQLEVASAATDYDHQPFEVTLARCLRYYQKSFRYNTVPSLSLNLSDTAYVPVVKAGAVANFFIFPFPVQMRVAPAITVYGSGSNQPYDFTISTACTGANNTDPSASQLYISFTQPAGAAIADFIAMGWGAAAEL